ncbi:MAG: hypothetical protein AB7E47_04815 [Desulfovibrionaceae bacterium]
METHAPPQASGDELRALERRLDRLRGMADNAVAAHGTTRQALGGVRDFLELAPQAAQRLEDLAAQLFGTILDEVEANLTHAVREILGQDRRVTSLRQIRQNRLSIELQIENQGQPEHILNGQGGSVCNILSTGLRLVALAQLDPATHRPFLVLDEQDCWLKPELVPKFMKCIKTIADALHVQVIVVSHHPVDLFAAHADRIYGLAPSREQGVVVSVLRDVRDV